MPDFKIVSAVVHLDEKSPHAHIVGVPVGRGYRRGLEKQAAKTKVFTQESLKELQEQMHIHAEKDMEEHPEILREKVLKKLKRAEIAIGRKSFLSNRKQKRLKH